MVPDGKSGATHLNNNTVKAHQLHQHAILKTKRLEKGVFSSVEFRTNFGLTVSLVLSAAVLLSSVQYCTIRLSHW